MHEFSDQEFWTTPVLDVGRTMILVTSQCLRTGFRNLKDTKPSANDIWLTALQDAKMSIRTGCEYSNETSLALVVNWSWP